MARTAERNPARIAEEILATRAQLDDTLDAIQRKLSPGQLIDQAMAYTRQGPGEMLTNFGHAAKRNPVAMVLTGVGIAWLVWGNSRPEYPAAYASAPHGDPLAEGFMAPQLREGREAEGRPAAAGERAREISGQVGERARAIGEQVTSRARESGGQASEPARHAGERVRHVGERARHLWQRTGRALGAAGERTSRMGTQIQGMMRREPIVLAAVGIAIGAAIGGAAAVSGTSTSSAPESEPQRATG